MNNIDDFNRLKPHLLSIKKNEVCNPNMPVDTYIQEAQDTYYWCNIDRGELATAGLNLTLIDDILTRSEALQYCQSIWVQEHDKIVDNESQLKELSQLAFTLRNELVQFYHLTFLDNSKLLEQIDQASVGYTNTDLIHDLIRLVQIGRSNTEILKQAYLDLTILDIATTYAENLELLLDKLNEVKFTSKPTKEIRDRAFTYLKQAVDGIRATGQLIFWRNQEKAQHYSSAYFSDSRLEIKASAVI